MGRYTDRILRRGNGRGRRNLERTEEFRCMKCGKVDRYQVGAVPVCCRRPMRSGGVEVRGGDPDAVRLDFVQIWPSPNRGSGFNRTEPPSVDWMTDGTPEEVYEVWQLRPGREKGEKIGWIGKRTTGYEYRMVPGIPSSVSAGFDTDKQQCGLRMLAAIMG